MRSSTDTEFFFKTEGVGQRLLSAAVGVPVSGMETAGECGPYGMAILASFLLDGNDRNLTRYLYEDVFRDAKSVKITASKKECVGFNSFLESYKKAFEVEKKAVEVF